MRNSKVLTVLASLLALAVGSSLATVEVVAVLEVRGNTTDIDSLFVVGDSLVMVRTPGFGGEPGETDSVSLGQHAWPRLIAVHWHLGGEPMEMVRIADPEPEAWYTLGEPPEERPQILFRRVAAVSEPDARPVLASIGAAPNPFSGQTRLTVRLARTARVKVEVYDATGRPVRALAAGSFEPGRYDWTWAGTDDAGTRLAGGVYFARLATDDAVSVRKLVLNE